MLRATRLALPVYAVLLFLFAHGVSSQGIPFRSTKLTMKSGTPVKLQLLQTISSGRAHKNDLLSFVVDKDVDVDGFTLISSGAKAEGLVIRVKRKRPLGIAGGLIIELHSVELATGEQAQLIGRKEFKGRSRTIRMAVGMAITAGIFLPAAPAFLLTPGRDGTALKGTEVTAYTESDFSVDAADLPVAGGADSELSEMIKRLPPRVLNGEGREGDMLNLIFAAKEIDLQEAFAHAGWLKVEKSTPQIIWHLLWQRNHYAKLPMNKLYVFGRTQDYSFALPDPNSIVARRHHLRIWKTDRAMDGVPLWVGAATHDVAIEFVKRKFRLFHRIDPDIDAERDFIARDLAKSAQVTGKQFVRCTEPVFNAKTATGQTYYSDSRILFLELKQWPAMAEATDVAGRRHEETPELAGIPPFSEKPAPSIH